MFVKSQNLTIWTRGTLTVRDFKADDVSHITSSNKVPKFVLTVYMVNDSIYFLYYICLDAIINL